MSQSECGTVRELIPDVGAARADEATTTLVESHAAGCFECGGELELARMLFATRPEVPMDLSHAVVSRVRRAPRMVSKPWWGVSAAAVAALALGIGITAGPGPDSGLDAGVEMVVEAEEEDEFWLSDDGVLAGAPVWETLSDEALAELLDDLSTLQGGQA
ncbi:MAG: hypothetical protein KJO65_09630 [Gemmatimonadetes bacterium]|nr:hypothetical protein [Gemmatimonadota bacterium]